MKITGFDFSDYTIKLKTPFLSSKGPIRERRGFLLTLNSSEYSAQGDIAPLPEFGSESPATAERILRELKTSFPYLYKDCNEVSEIEFNLNNLTPFPALKHGLEQALLSLVAKKKKTDLKHLLEITSTEKVILNAVVGLQNAEETVKMVRNYVDSGYKTIKLKAGRKSFDQDLEIIEKVRLAVGHDIKIRLDVNGKWEIEEAVEKLNKLAQYDIQYVEQPVSLKQELSEISKISPVPIAADESIRSVSDAFEFIENRLCPILVLKPMMLGGILDTLKIIDKARRNNIITIISSSFESAIGKKALLFLASSINNDYAHGIGTDEYYASPGSLSPDNGMITINSPDYFLT